MEYIKRCKVCGHVFCYTDQDVKDQFGNAVAGIFSGLGQIASAASGSMLNMHMAGSQAERVRNQQIDLNRCPNCRSTDLETITKEELQKLLAAEALKNGANVNINANASTESLLKRARIFLEDSDWPTANAYCDAVLDTEPENAEAYLGKLMAELQVTERAKLADLAEPFDNNENYKKIVRFANDELLNEILGYIEHIKIENLYKGAKEFLESAKTENEYWSAANKFKELTGYKDSEKISLECFEKAKLIKAENERKAEEARIAAEKAKIEAERKAEKARMEAEAEKKKLKKIAIIATPIVVVVVAAIVIFTNVIQPNMKYNAACESIKEKEYIKAYETFIELGDYKDSIEKAESIYFDYRLQQIKTKMAGESVYFGRYEQDGSDNGTEEIEWIIVKREDDKVQLISKYGLDYQRYHFEDAIVTWENCSLRVWLNDDFLNSAFSNEEKKYILETDTTASTKDKIFLLSEKDVEYHTLFSKRCKPTAYASSKEPWGFVEEYDSWWLRKEGLTDLGFGVSVTEEGEIRESTQLGNSVNWFNLVRPALWVDLSAVE